MNYDVTLYSVSSEGAMIEALRFGNADIAIMDGDQHGLAGNNMTWESSSRSEVRR